MQLFYILKEKKLFSKEAITTRNALFCPPPLLRIIRYLHPLLQRLVSLAAHAMLKIRRPSQRSKQPTVLSFIFPQGQQSWHKLFHTQRNKNERVNPKHIIFMVSTIIFRNIWHSTDCFSGQSLKILNTRYFLSDACIGYEPPCLPCLRANVDRQLVWAKQKLAKKAGMREVREWISCRYCNIRSVLPDAGVTFKNKEPTFRFQLCLHAVHRKTSFKIGLK